MPPDAVTLTPVSEQEFAVLRELAGTIWRQHYAAIISPAQIECMLAGRFSDDALSEHVQAVDRWLELLRVSGKPVGYCGYELAELVIWQHPVESKGLVDAPSEKLPLKSHSLDIG